MSKQSRYENQAEFFPTQLFTSAALGDGLGRVSGMWMRACVELQKELASFASSRLQSDMELASAMAQCPNAIELAKLQQRWLATTLRDYTQEASQLMQVATEAMGKSMSKSAEATKRAGETIFSGRAAE